MQQKLKVYDYAIRMRISVPTVYRQIKAGKLETERIDDITYVVFEEEPRSTFEEQDNLIIELRERISESKVYIEQQQAEIELLHNALSEAQQTIQQMQQDSAEAQQRSDTIILQLTRQFDEQTKLLEDMRQKNEPKNIGFFKRLLRKT